MFLRGTLLRRRTSGTCRIFLSAYRNFPMLSGGYENQRARIDNGTDQFCHGRDQYCTECHSDLRKTGYYPDGCPGCSNSDIKRKDDRTGLLYPDFQPSGLHSSVSDPSVSKKPGTGKGFPEMRNADSRCVPVLGSRIYFVFFFYGTSGSRRGRCQFCGGGCP